jgi:LemA protein
MTGIILTARPRKGREMGGGKKGCLLVLVIVGVVGFFLYPFIQETRSHVLTLDEQVKAAWAQVENQLQSRMDLIPNYVETVKAYAPQEQTVYGAVTQLHVKAAVTMLRPQKIAINSELTAALDRLSAVAERYPELTRDQTFIALQGKLADIKNRIAEARVRYNEAATQYNTYRQGFPIVIVATFSGFPQAPLYEAEVSGDPPGLPRSGAEPPAPLSGTQ